jgi:hypothetical protein
MVFDILATARDLSVILLAIEFLVLGAVPLIALYFITRWLRDVVRKARPFLRQVVGYALQGLDAINKGLILVAKPFIWLHMAYAALTGFWRRWRWGQRSGTRIVGRRVVITREVPLGR